jgi:hypothetical protein
MARSGCVVEFRLNHQKVMSMKSGTALLFVVAENPAISRSVTADISADDGLGKRYFMYWMIATRFVYRIELLKMTTVPELARRSAPSPAQYFLKIQNPSGSTASQRIFALLTSSHVGMARMTAE